jgi:TolB-like protein/DNA-binding winged helix-turn-helix (wHTH) protein
MGDQSPGVISSQPRSDDRKFRFGIFEADLRAGELRKAGSKIKLYGQPFAVLAILLERAGEVVTREELQQKLWPADTFVDFAHGLNKAINKLRGALSEDADNPRFIETLPRRGYRFIAPVTKSAPTQSLLEQSPAKETPGESSKTQLAAGQSRKWKLAIWASLSAVIILGVVLTLYFRGRSVRTSVTRPVNSIAVLPFSDLSPQKDQSYFADGMTEALITNLAQIEPLRIISRTSAMRYKDVTKPIPDIAKELGVDAIVEGSVLSEGEQVRISVNLVDGRTDQTLWSRQYERTVRNVLSLQREVALAIASEIRVKTATSSGTHLHHPPVAVDPEAYRFYLKGLEARYRDEPEAWRQAAEWFDKAVARDPNFAPAYVGLATAYTLLGGFTPYLTPADAEAKASTAVARALELDPDLAGAYLARGLIYEVLKWDWAEAERAFRRSIELNPGLSETRFEYGQLLLRMARFDEAHQEMRRAIELDPRAAFMYHAWANVYFYSGQYPEALNQLQNSLHLDPGSVFSRAARGEVFLISGEVNKAIQALEDKQVFRVSAWSPAYLAVAYELSGRNQDSLRALRELEGDARKERRFASWSLAMAYSGLRQRAKACQWLKVAALERSGELIYMKVEPLLKYLHSEPCYQEVLRKVGLAEPS